MTNNLAETKQMADFLLRKIDKLARPVRLMEVCGTHTVAIFKAGLRQVLPANVELVSGPGCPVCVTSNEYMDIAIRYSQQPNVIITTFGDMLRVPGSGSTLTKEKAKGADIRIVYSPLDSLAIAKANPAKKVVFLAVGFETTAPAIAATILTAKQKGPNNFFVLSAQKLVPPALRALLNDDGAKVDGFLLPGNVCAITGETPFAFLAEEYQMPAVIAGFSPLELLEAIYQLMLKIYTTTPQIGNQYTRIVKTEGNPAARAILEEVYQPCDAVWRGLGNIRLSGLALKESYQSFDIQVNMPIAIKAAPEHPLCRCGEVLRGRISPKECSLFGKACIPEQPVGACMVSVEGTCAAWYKYGSWRWEG